MAYSVYNFYGSGPVPYSTGFPTDGSSYYSNPTASFGSAAVGSNYFAGYSGPGSDGYWGDFGSSNSNNNYYNQFIAPALSSASQTMQQAMTPSPAPAPVQAPAPTPGAAPAPTPTPAPVPTALDDKTVASRLQLIAGKLDTQAGAAQDGKFSAEDLSNALADQNGRYTAEEKQALQYLADNKGDFRLRLDQLDGTADGVISTASINKAMVDPTAKPATPINNAQDAYKIINNNLALFQQNPDDKLISYNDLSNALASNDPKYTEDVKNAVKWIQSHKESFDKADLLDNTDDDQIQVDVISRTAGQGEIPDRFGFNYDGKDADQASINKAIDVLSANGDAGFKKIDNSTGGNPDGVINWDDMQGALKDNTGKFTAEEKQAIITLYGGTDDNGDDSAYDRANGRDSKANYDEIKGQRR